MLRYLLICTICLITAGCGGDASDANPEEAVRDNGKDYVRHCIRAAKTLGATNLVGPLYSAVGRTWQSTPEERAADIAILVSILKELAGYAGDHGITLCLEPLNRFETSFVNLAQQAIEIIDRLNCWACKIG